MAETRPNTGREGRLLERFWIIAPGPTAKNNKAPRANYTRGLEFLRHARHDSNRSANGTRGTVNGLNPLEQLARHARQDSNLRPTA